MISEVNSIIDRERWKRRQRDVYH